MIMDPYAKRRRHADDLPGHVDIGEGRGHVARRVVVARSSKFRNIMKLRRFLKFRRKLVPGSGACPVSYTHLTLPTTPYV